MIDLKKKYKTVGGAEVKLITIYGQGELPVLGAYKNDKGEWIPKAWNLEGRTAKVKRMQTDLAEVPDTKTITLYRNNLIITDHEQYWEPSYCLSKAKFLDLHKSHKLVGEWEERTIEVKND